MDLILIVDARELFCSHCDLDTTHLYCAFSKHSLYVCTVCQKPGRPLVVHHAAKPPPGGQHEANAGRLKKA